MANYDTQRGITNVQISNVTKNSARITFNTAISQKTSVICSNDCGRYSDSTAMAAHLFNIQNLSPGTEYSLSIIRDNDLDVINTEHYHFKTMLSLNSVTLPTLTIIDTTKPVISNIAVSQVTTSSARITWKTDENSSTTVVLSGGGQSGAVINNSNQSSVTLHSINLNNLSEYTIYSYIIKSKDGSGNEAVTASRSFSTLGIHPVISDVRISNINSTGARIRWTTNKDTTSRVMYTVKDTNNVKVVENSNAVTQHDFSLSGLEPDTKYVYQVESVDSDNIWAYGPTQEFKTLALAESQSSSSSLGSGNTAGTVSIGTTGGLTDANPDGNLPDSNNLPAAKIVTTANEIPQANSTNKFGLSFLDKLPIGWGSAVFIFAISLLPILVVIIIVIIVIKKWISRKKNSKIKNK